jgi:hypothetical protein
MASRDMHSNVDARTVRAPVTVNDGGAPSVSIIDTHGFESLEFVVAAGDITTGGFSSFIEHGQAANLSDAAEVTAAQLLGAAPVFTKSPDDSSKTKRVGYRGHKRYVRLTPVSDNPRAAGTATLGEGLASGEKVTIESVDFVAKAKFASNVVTCAGVQANDTVTIGGVEFTAIANGGTPAALEFEVGAGGTADADTAAALAAAIGDAAGANGGVNASNTAGQATVTISAVTAGAAGNDITIATSTGVRLAITTAGGKLAGAYDAAQDEWPIESSLDLSAAALAAAISASENEAIAGIVTASAAAAVCTVSAVLGGSAGNLLTFTKTGDHITASGSGTLADGAEAVFVVGVSAVLGHPNFAPVP